jgi:hypothetical protein
LDAGAVTDVLLLVVVVFSISGEQMFSNTQLFPHEKKNISQHLSAVEWRYAELNDGLFQISG